MDLARRIYSWLGTMVVALTLLGSVASADASVIYVRAGASPSGDGASWATAYPLLNNALQVAISTATSNNPVEIWVATGVYRPTTGSDRTASFNVPGYTTIRGGFAGTETNAAQRALTGNQTVLSGDIGATDPQAITAATNFSDLSTVKVQDGSVSSQVDNSYNVVVVNFQSGVTLDRLTITGGMANNAAVQGATIGSMIQPVVPSADSSTPTGYVSTLDRTVSGAGLFVQSSAIAVTNCIFARNTAIGEGGAVVAQSSYISFDGTTFVRNYSGLVGGAASLQDCAPTVNNDTFYGNHSVDLGGAVWLQRSSGSVAALAAQNNTLLQLGALANAQASATTGVTPIDSQQFNDTNLLKSVNTIQKNVRSVMEKAANTADDAAVDAESLITEDLAGAVRGLGGAYAVICIAVSTVNLGADIALLLGANPNDPFFKTWGKIASAFATYCTPMGLIEFFAGLIEGAEPVNHGAIQQANRTNDYKSNHNMEDRSVFTNNQFTLNSTPGFGGAVATMRWNLVLANSYFQQNEGDVGGGAVAGFSYNDLQLENCAVMNNQSAGGHSAISVGSSCLLRVVSSTILNNHSAVSGGRAVSTETGAVTFITNTLMWGNTGGSGAHTTINADVFSARRSDLTPAAQSAYDNAGDSHFPFVGWTTVYYSDIQGLGTMSFGFSDGGDDSDGFNLQDGNPNAGEGVSPSATSGSGHNFSREPSLIATIVPSPYSPLVHAGNVSVGDLTQGLDILGNGRVSGSRGGYWTDIGAVQWTGSFPSNGIIYVNASATGANTGLNWTDAFNNLPAAFALGASPGAQIWVAKGTYYATNRNSSTDVLNLQPGVSVVGGFTSGATDISQSDPANNPTIVTGAASGSTMLMVGTSFNGTVSSYSHPRVIQGLHFTRSAGHGVVVSSPVVVKNCTFDLNAGRGLVITDDCNLADDLTGQIIDSVFQNNSGGGVEADEAVLTVEGSRFYSNTANYGAGLWITPKDRGLSKVERTVFAYNAATSGGGGGVQFDGDTLLISQSVFYSNYAPYVGQYTGITGEVGTTAGGAGLYIRPVGTLGDDPSTTLINNIFYSNRLTGTFPATRLEYQNVGVPNYGNHGAPLTLQGNDIEGLGQLATPGDANGNLDYVPDFVNAGSNNFQLNNDSMLLNRGVTYSSPTDQTVLDGTVDIGAFENSSTATALALTAAPVFTAVQPTAAGRVFTLGVTIVGGSSSLQWQVERPDGLGWVNLANDSVVSGATAAQVTFTNPPYTWTGYQYRLTYVDSNSQHRYSAAVTATFPAAFLYVTTTGAGTQDGTSWASAMSTVTDAEAKAQSYTQIFIAGGSYAVMAGTLAPGVRVYGGFAGTETLASQRTTGHVTTLSMSTVQFLNGHAIYPPGSVFTSSGAATWPSSPVTPVPTIIDGFTFVCTDYRVNNVISVTNGNTVVSNDLFTFSPHSEGAVVANQGTVAITGCSFSGTYSTAINLLKATATISACTFTTDGGRIPGGNLNPAGAIYSQGGSALTVTDSTFTNCWGANAGAIYTDTSGPYTAGAGTLLVERCRFTSNSGIQSGAIYVGAPGASRIANSLFLTNSTILFNGNPYYGDSGAAIKVASSGAVVTVAQCTIVGQSNVTNSAAIMDVSSGAGTLVNSVVWNNSTSGFLFQNVTITNDYIQGASYDPLIDPSSADYAPLDGSPLLNVGGANATLSGTTDLEGHPRMFSGRSADLGATEFQGTPTAVAYVRTKPVNQTVFVGQPVSFTTDASLGSNVGSTPIVWQYYNGSSWQPIFGLSDWTITLNNGVSVLSSANPPLSENGLQIRAQFQNYPNLNLRFTLTVNPRIILHVNPTAPAGGNGLTWATAFQTIGQAFAAANQYTDIWVATGTYNETNLTPTPGANLILGFNGTETLASQANPGANPVLVGSALASRTLVVADTTTLFSPLSLSSGETPRWQVNRNDGQGWVDLTANADVSFATAGGVPAITIIGDLANPAYQYRVVFSQNGSDTFTSVPATITVISRPQVYVDANVSGGAHTGADWANAYSDLGAALAAYPAYADLFVAQGTYTVNAATSYFLRRSLTLTGGYVAGTSTRDPVAHRTILASTGGSTSQSVTLSTQTDRGIIDSLTVIDGFVFQSTRKAMVLTSVSPVIRNCRFEGVGAAIIAQGSNLTIDTCAFLNGLDSAIQADVTGMLTISHSDFEGNGSATGIANQVVVLGSAIELGNSINRATPGLGVTVTDTLFSGNLSAGGGTYVINAYEQATVSLDRCQFVGNKGGVESGSGAATIRNCLFARNSGNPVLAVGGVGSVIAYCTIADNSAYTSAISFGPSGGEALEDCIVWNNLVTGNGVSQVPISGYYYGPGYPTVARDIISFVPSWMPSSGIVPFDPLFVDEANNNFQLQPGSPAIGLGASADLVGGQVDLAGLARPQGATPAAGAYEATVRSAPVYSFGLPAALTGPVGSNFTLSYPNPYGYALAWQYSTDGVNWVTIGRTPPGVTQAATSYNSLTLNGLLSTATGLQIRATLASGSTTYTSPAIPITVQGFQPLYVDASVAASGNGQSWAAAYKTLSEALAAADSIHRIINVAAGTYQPGAAAPDSGTFHLSGFQVYGGYPAGGSGTRNSALTILTSTNGTAVTLVDQAPIPTLVDGLTVQNSATGVAVTSGSPTLNNLIVQGNSSTGLVIHGSPTVTDSVFKNNTGTNGGGIAVLSGSPSFERDTISGNSATGNGGGVLVQANTVFNSVLISGNQATSGGGIYVAAGVSETLNQVTLAGNQAQQGGAITMIGNGQTALNDSIVWGNSATGGGNDPELYTANAIAFNYALQHTVVGVTSLTSGALRYDPVFVSPAAASSAPTTAGNYQLAAASPAIEAGVNTVVTGHALDRSDNPRIVGTTVDLGAYEYTGANGAPLVITAQPANLVYNRGGSNDTLSVTASNSTAVQWQYELPGASSFVTLADVTGFSGANTATLTISGATAAMNGTLVRAVITALDGSKTTSNPATLTVYQPQYYVNAGRSGTDAGDGQSWATAFRSLAAVAALPFDPEGTTVWVAAGSYSIVATTFAARPGLSLYGGFAGTETSLGQRNVATHLTTVSTPAGAAPLFTVVAAAGGSLPVTIDGFTLSLGGEGVEDLTGVALTLNQDTFSQNQLGVRTTAPTTITACSFVHNTEALTASGGALAVSRSTFCFNGQQSGSPSVVVGSAATTLDNCLFAVNYGPALVVNGGTLRNLTIAGNSGGPGLTTSGAVSLYNSIIWGNRVWSFFLNFTAQVSGGLANSAGNAIEGVNLSASPFVSAVTANPNLVLGNYQLSAVSGLADSGVNSDATLTGVDLAGAPRLVGVLIDPGAYEYQSDPYALSAPTFTMGTTGLPARFSVTTVAPVSAYAWQESLDGNSWTTLANGGAYAGVSTATLAVNGDATYAGRQYRAQLTFVSGTMLATSPVTLVFGAVTAQPAGSTTSAVFTAAASGSPTGYIWQQSVAGGAYVNLTDSGTYLGTTTSALTVVSGGAGLAGNYRALVSYLGSLSNPTNAVAYAKVAIGAIPSGVGSQGNLAYGSTGFGFTLAGGIQLGSLTDQTLAVYSALTGRRLLADLVPPVLNGSAVNLGFRSALPAGDRVSVTVTDGLRSAAGVGATAQVWQFRNGTNSGAGRFEAATTISSAGTGNTALASGDLGGNGTLDVIVAGPNGNQVFAGDGHGGFTAVGTPFGAANAKQIVLGGLTATGAIDAVIVNSDGSVGIWSNDGTGSFTLRQTLAETAQAVAIGDLNGDGAQDLFVARASGNLVYLNGGSGSFTSSGSAFGGTAGTSVALGDVNGDGTLDALVGGSASSELWTNQGDGTFTQLTTVAAADQVDLADLDGDGQTDLVLTRANRAAQVWHNYGGGSFAQVGVALGGGASTLATGDVNGDGKVDVVLTDATGAIGVWSAQSVNNYIRLPDQSALSFGAHAALVDVDGDGALDLVGLNSSGALAVSVYHVTDTVLTEWTPNGTVGTIAAAGLTHGGGAATAYVRIASLPTLGTLASGGTAVQVGEVYSLAAASALTYTPGAFNAGEDAFTFNVSTTDAATFGSAAVPYYLYVIPVVTDIVANADTITVTEGESATTLTGGGTSLLANDVDNNHGDTLTASLVQRPTHGSVTVNPDGTFVYVQDNSEVTADQFTYRATDATVGRSADAVVNITIIDVNHAPTAIKLTASGNTVYTGQPAGIVVGSFTGTDQDPGDAALLSFSLVSGTGSDNNGEFTITGSSLVTAGPLPVSEGVTRTIRVRATDGGGLTFEQAIPITLTQQPLATAMNLSVSEDSTLPITLTGTGGAATLTYAVASQPVLGAVSGSGSSYVYQNAALNRATDSFTFTVSDGVLTSAPATVTITIVPVNHAPTLPGATLPNTDDKTPVSVVLQGADPDGDTVNYVVVTQGHYGQASISGSTLTYTPSQNVLTATATDYVTVYAYDGNNGISNAIAIPVQVTPINDPPLLTGVAAAGYGMTRGLNQVLTFPVSLTDPDSTPALLVGTAPQHGTVSIDAGGNVTYRPADGFVGTDTFTLYGTDGSLSTTPQTITVSVQDPLPVASAGAASGNENTTINTFLNGADGNGDALTATIVDQPAHGTVSYYQITNDTWALAYTPALNYFGTDSLTFTMTDAVGVASAPATMTFTVNQVISPPTASGVTYSGSGLTLTVPLTLSANDPQGLPLTYRLVTQPAHGTLSGNGPTLTYTLTAAYVGTDSFTYVVNNTLGDSAPATVTLTFTNDHPGAVVQSALETAYRGLSSTWNVLAGAYDPWGNPIFISDIGQPAHGTVTKTDSTVTYQHNGDSATDDQFTFQVSNFSGTTTTATVFVTIADRSLIVTSGADTGDGTLRAAFNAVNAAKFQKLAPAFTDTPDWTIRMGPYLGSNGVSYNYDLATSSESDPTLGDSALTLVDGVVTIQASGGPITVDLANGAPTMRVLHVGATAHVSISGLSFAGGTAHLGGTIYNEGVLSLQNATVSGGTAQSLDGNPGLGGGIYESSHGISTLTLNNVILSGNTADQGGALYNLAGQISITGGAFTANVASLGGAIANVAHVFPAQITDAGGTAFTGNGAGSDVMNVGQSPVVASFTADASVTMSNPTSLWVGAVPDTTVQSHFTAPVPVVLLQGQAVGLALPHGTPGTASLTGNESPRTLTVDFDSAPAGTYTGTVTAADGSGGQFLRTFNLTVDPASSRPVVTRDTYLTVAPYGTLAIQTLAMANVIDPEGHSTEFDGFNPTSNPASGSLGTVQGVWFYYANDQGSDTISYTTRGGVTGTVHITIASLTQNASTEADSGDGSLRSEIEAAAVNYQQPWTLQPTGLPDGLVTLSTADENDPLIGLSAFVIRGNVTIDGSLQTGGLTIGVDPAAVPMRLFHVLPGATLTLKNLTVQGGTALQGGAIYNEGAVILDQAVLQNNIATGVVSGTAAAGGAIYNNGGTLTVTQSTLTANTVTVAGLSGTALGGAIFVHNGTVSLTNATLTGNTADDAGAVYVQGDGAAATLHLLNSRLGGSSQNSDLNEGTLNNGSVLVTRYGSTISAMAGAWLSDLTDASIGMTGQITFFANDALSGMTLTATADNQTVMPNAGLTIAAQNNAHVLSLAGNVSGATMVHLVAASGNVQFEDSFTVTSSTEVTQPPIAVAASASLFPLSSATIDAVAADSDPNGLTYSITAVSTPSHGTAAIVSGKIVYTETDPSFNGLDTFTYTLTNSAGASATATVTITVQATAVTVSSASELFSAIATIESNTGADDYSSADGLAAPHPGGVPWTIKIDPSAAGQTWTLTGHQYNDGAYYTAILIHGNVTIDATAAPGFTLYVPPGGYSGPPLRIFTVYPGGLLTLKSLTLNNASPLSFGGAGKGGAVRNLGTFTAANVTFHGDTVGGTLGYGGGLYNDGGVATLTNCAFTSDSATGFGGGIASHNGTLNLTNVTFSGNSAPTGKDLYVYGDGATATVNAISSAPSFVLGSINGGNVVSNGLVAAAPYTINRYGTSAVSIAVNTLLNASLGSGLVFVGADTTSVSGVAVTVSGGVLTYGATSINANDSFTYRVHDVNGMVATATVLVHWIDQPPVAKNLSFSRTAGQTLTIPVANLLVGATDPDGDVVSFVSADSYSAQGSSLTLTDPATLVYDPGSPDSISGDDTFHYTIQDSHGVTAAATVTIHTTAVAITPVVTVSVKNGVTTVSVSGAPNTSYSVTVSSSLLTWTTLGVVTTDALGSATITDATLPTEAAGRYYRVAY